MPFPTLRKDKEGRYRYVDVQGAKKIALERLAALTKGLPIVNERNEEMRELKKRLKIAEGQINAAIPTGGQKKRIVEGTRSIDMEDEDE